MLAVSLAVLLAGFSIGLRKLQQESTVQLAGTGIRLEIADTAEERAKGLGGREQLPADTGMLFVYEDALKHCFWMKDTHFPLDIIWLDEAKTIIHMAENIQPASYPSKFCPDEAALYVVEVAAGRAESLGLGIGTQLNF